MYLINILKDIEDDFNKPQYISSKVLSRRFIMQNGIVVLVNMHREGNLSEVGFSLNEALQLDELKELPKWKGMEQRISAIPENGMSNQYLFFTQLPEDERHIFNVLMQDIVDSIEKCANKIYTISIICNALKKWNNFFKNEKKYILEGYQQQGLYGELYILEKLILLRGKSAIKCWTGCNAETHDFYIESNAIEVKTSSTKGPDKISISNEYQLDDTGLLGKLYLVFIKLRNSEVDGENLSNIVERIINTLDEASKIEFVDRLFKVGYVYQMPELYNKYFSIRDESCYEVKEGFPRIVPKVLSKGVGSVDYIVSIDACSQYQITVESFFNEVS